MELICPDSSWEDIVDLYHDVYQLWRLQGRICCDERTEECICQDILDSIKECLWCKQLSMLPEAEQIQSSAGTPSPSPHTKFIPMNHANYERFTAIK